MLNHDFIKDSKPASILLNVINETRETREKLQNGIFPSKLPPPDGDVPQVSSKLGDFEAFQTLFAASLESGLVYGLLFRVSNAPIFHFCCI